MLLLKGTINDLDVTVLTYQTLYWIGDRKTSWFKLSLDFYWFENEIQIKNDVRIVGIPIPFSGGRFSKIKGTASGIKLPLN